MTKATRRQILVVDDDEFIRAVCLVVLSGAGHEVSVASHGIAALQRLKVSEFDLIIADLEMPKLDGIGLYERASNEYPHLADKFLFMSGRLSQTNRTILEQWKKKCLIKPFNVKELLQHVGTILL
ncbi:MAG: hypothetical protein A3J24_05800 [Deltaproteobacteria bacterium RIFCSPLOWO2_02_FULL_53_8]|nr:MAG: hypothetical protein A3J24_05800 [Deltaproteobacteria bacterium RIFCSPLOWO2_02_FULL_53_8]